MAGKKGAKPKAYEKQKRADLAAQRKAARANVRTERMHLASARVVAADVRKAARANVRTERMHLASARVVAADVRKTARPEAKAQIVAMRAQLKAAAIKLRDGYRRRRQELLEAYRSDARGLRDEHRRRVEELRQHVVDANQQARALVELRREMLAKARAVAAAYVSAASAKAAARRGEQFAEAMHVAAVAVEHEARELLPAFNRWTRTKVAREAYRDAVAFLKKKHPRGDWRHSDAGEWIAVYWLEKAADEIDALKHQAWEDAAECYERAAIQIESLDMNDPEQAREAETIWATCKEFGG